MTFHTFRAATLVIAGILSVLPAIAIVAGAGSCAYSSSNIPIVRITSVPK